MQVIMRCTAGENYDCVSNAIVDFDRALIEFLADQLKKVDQIKKQSQECDATESYFEGFQYDRHDPTFIDASLAPTPNGLSDEAFKSVCSRQYYIFEKFMDNYVWDEEVGMRPCKLIVNATDNVEDGHFYWEGEDKHGDMGCRVQTAPLYMKDLQIFAQKLNLNLCGRNLEDLKGTKDGE